MCNGCPRTGTHLVMKMLGMLGFQDSGFILVRLGKNQEVRARLLVSEDSKVIVPTDRVFSLDHSQFVHAHVVSSALRDFKSHKIITTYRDPRDSAVSMVRWHRHRNKFPEKLRTLCDEELLVDLLLRGYYGFRRTTWVQFVRWFEGWKRRPGLHLEFSSLGSMETAMKIAAFVGVPGPLTIEGWLGNGKMFEGQEMHISLSSHMIAPSRWEDFWTPRVQKVWEETDGDVLLAEMGYA